jgi:hypothetical protein
MEDFAWQASWGMGGEKSNFAKYCKQRMLDAISSH